MTTTGPNRILDEFAKLMTDAAGAAQGVRREVEQAFRAQAERLLNSMEVVQREEFEAVRDMAVKARAENKALAARIEALEAKLSETAGSSSAEQTLRSRLHTCFFQKYFTALFHNTPQRKPLFGESLIRQQ